MLQICAYDQWSWCRHQVGAGALLDSQYHPMAPPGVHGIIQYGTGQLWQLSAQDNSCSVKIKQVILVAYVRNNNYSNMDLRKPLLL